MDEYISKQIFKEKYLCCGWLPEMSEEEFDAFPAADVAPVRHAAKAESTISKTGLMCTACYSDADADAAYCKYCGALLDGEEDEHEVSEPGYGGSV